MATPDHAKWTRFSISPWWIGYQDLPYVNEPFNDPKSLSLWQGLGYTQQKFTGDMYDMRSPEPDWIAGFKKYFTWDFFSWSIYRMTPGCVLPNHWDTYARFKEIYSITDCDTIRRAIVFLEDWKSGHYLEIDSEPIVQWRAGDGVVWKNDVPHLAANMGMTNRYTLQITGVSDQDTF